MVAAMIADTFDKELITSGPGMLKVWKNDLLDYDIKGPAIGFTFHTTPPKCIIHAWSIALIITGCSDDNTLIVWNFLEKLGDD